MNIRSQFNYWIVRGARHLGLVVQRTERVHEPTLPALPLAYSLIERKQPHVQLVQLGAYDGNLADPVQHLLAVSHPQLRALLVEPQPGAFQLLQTKYQNDSRIQCIQAAVTVTGSDEDVEIHIPQGESHSPLSSLNAAQIKKRSLKNLATCAVRVPGRRLETLLKSADIARVDILQVDCEGMDDKIIRAALDAGIEPAAIHFETANLSAQQHRDLIEVLHQRGYGLIPYPHDCLALKLFLLE